MRLEIANGTIVTPAGCFTGNVVCESGRIASIETPSRVAASRPDELVDATGLLVFPGFIDPHVHSREPGLTHKEDFAHMTRAAAAGGVTTVFEMPNTVPPLYNVEILEQRITMHRANAHVDFGLWGMAVGLTNLDQIGPLIDNGVVGIKMFWGYALQRDTLQIVYTGSRDGSEDIIMPPSVGGAYELFAEVARHDGLLAVHCEDPDVINARHREIGRPIEGYSDLLHTRPPLAEALHVAAGCELALSTGCRFHVVHTSSQRATEILRSARLAGADVSAETCPQYLTFTADDYERIGRRMKLYPPIRRDDDREALWQAVRGRVIELISSDHGPHSLAEKDMPLDVQPAGAVGVESLVPSMLDHLACGRVSASDLAWLMSESTARRFRVYPKKGVITPGSDADLTIVDLDRAVEIEDSKLHSKSPCSLWNGKRLQGAPVLTVVRGQIVMRDGAPCGAPCGDFVATNAGLEHSESVELSKPARQLVH